MIIQDIGKIDKGFYVTGHASMPVYLLDGPQPVLFDAGLTAAAFEYEAGIKKILGSRPPAYLFLTHSHFDHVGSASHFKKIWPELRLAGSSRCGEILQRENAVRLMRTLNAESADNILQAGVDNINEAPFEPVALDIAIEPGQEIELEGSLTVTALNTPGHTWDFMSYWIPEKKLLIASEAVATYESGGYLQPEFLVDYTAYLESLAELETLGASILCVGHHAVFTGSDARAHIQNSIAATKAYLSMAEDFLTRENGDIDRAVQQVKAAEWDNRPWPKQAEGAYLLNTVQRVKVIWAQMNNQMNDRVNTPKGD